MTPPRPKSSDTLVDPSRTAHRLKRGLVPERTGIFLRIESGPARGRGYTLSAGGVYVVGREDGDIRLDDPKASRKHAELGLYGPGAWVVRDLASTNGTWLNGRRITDRARLANGDLLRIGDSEIRFTLIEDAVPLS